MAEVIKVLELDDENDSPSQKKPRVQNIAGTSIHKGKLNSMTLYNTKTI